MGEALPEAAPAQAAPSEDEYQTFSAALSASARGRAFLAEYARRHRGADTEILLAALARLEALIRTQRASEPTREEVRALLGTIRNARPEIAARSLPARAAKLAQLLDLLEQRLERLAETADGAPPLEARLAVVPDPDEPELPIPSPVAQPPTLSLAHDNTPPPVLEKPEAALSEPQPAPPPLDPLAPLMLLTEHERLALFT